MLILYRTDTNSLQLDCSREGVEKLLHAFKQAEQEGNSLVQLTINLSVFKPQKETKNKEFALKISPTAGEENLLDKEKDGSTIATLKLGVNNAADTNEIEFAIKTFSDALKNNYFFPAEFIRVTTRGKNNDQIYCKLV